MTADRWRQIEQVYWAALEREENDRSGFLNQACAGDDDLRQEVESLLASHERAASFIEHPRDDVAAGMVVDEQPRSIIGRTTGHYQLRSLLSAGGMGEVYLAQDLHLGRRVALKLLLKEFTLDRERVHRFHLEARAACGLNHPNIITIYELGEIGETHFIATEFVEGSTLRQQMENNRLKLHVILKVVIQVASALAEAHKAGIIHRDIKPENIMMRPDGLVKVLDFGLAKLTDPQVFAPDAHASTAT